jgi:hypothetical protein
MPGGDLQPVRVTAGDPHRVAVQVPADDGQLAPDDLGVEHLAGTGRGAGTEEPGVVGDPLAPHALPSSRLADFALGYDR